MMTKVGIAWGSLFKFLAPSVVRGGVKASRPAAEQVAKRLPKSISIVKNVPMTHSKVLKDGYAALEQYQDRGEINGRADEYSFCATMYYLLTGERPPTPQQRRSQDAKLKLPSKPLSCIPPYMRSALSMLRSSSWPRKAPQALTSMPFCPGALSL